MRVVARFVTRYGEKKSTGNVTAAHSARGKNVTTRHTRFASSLVARTISATVRGTANFSGKRATRIAGNASTAAAIRGLNRPSAKKSITAASSK